MNDVVVSFEAADRTLLYVDIRYTIRRTNDRRNLVFPFYVIPGGNEMALPFPNSTTAGSRIWSTMRSVSSSSAAPTGPITTSPTPA